MEFDEERPDLWRGVDLGPRARLLRRTDSVLVLRHRFLIRVAGPGSQRAKPHIQPVAERSDPHIRQARKDQN
jgi:hypothetical protein